MTYQQKSAMLTKLSAAYLANLINTKDYNQKVEAVHREFYKATYGELDLSDIPA
jgi:hypothetical protein